MSQVRKKDTAPEIRLRRALWGVGLRGWRLRPKLPGTPDIVFRRDRLAIFVDGCFWHSCPRCAIPMPRTNRRYWIPKLKRNVARDKQVTRELRSRGWAVLRIWEHELSHQAERSALRIAARLGRRLQSDGLAETNA